MATTIVTKYGGDAPAASDIVRGELAVDTENGRLYTENSSGAVVELGLNPEGNIDVTGSVTADGLVVDGASSGSTVATFTANANVDTPLLVFQRSGGAVAGKIAYDDTNTAITFGTTTNHEIRFLTNNTEKMQLDASGALVLNNSGGDAQMYFGGTSGTNRMYLARSGSDSLLWNVSNGVMRFGTNDTERMRIDASGNVGIGVVPETWQSATDVLQVGLGGSFAGNTTNPSRAYLSANYYINSSNQESYIATDEASQYFQNAGTHTFKVAPSGSADSAISWTTAMTIDNSGNLLVGTTDSTPYNNSGTGNGGAGIQGDGLISAAREDFPPAIFNRLVSDGNIVEFRKDGAVVGRIGTLSSKIHVGSDDTSLFFDSLRDALVPHNGSTNAARDAAIDLGRDVVRFRDLYLSGKASVDTLQFAQNSSATGATEAVYRPTTGSMAFKSNSGERMRIDSSGSVGISNSIASDFNAGANTLVVGSGSGSKGMTIYGSTQSNIFFADGTAGTAAYIGRIEYSHSADSMAFYVNNSPAMTIDSSGNVGIGVTPLQKLHVSGSVFASGYYITALQGNSQLTDASTSSGSNPSYIGQGLISVTVSDVKAKENFGAVDENECLNKIVSLAEHVKKFDWLDEDWKKEKGRTVGMVAQEIYENHSEFVHKPENYNDDGWAIRYQEIVPTLIKAIQEQQATIEALTARIAALES